MGDEQGSGATLRDALEDPARREAIVVDLVGLVDEEVRARGGLRGAALRAGYAAFQRIRPGIVRVAVDRLLPDLAVAMGPFWEEAVRTGSDRCFSEQADRIAEQLLEVTDRLSARSSNRVLIRLYGSLRPSARRHLAQSVPRLPPVIRRHTA
jgi:hypothetical protein